MQTPRTEFAYRCVSTEKRRKIVGTFQSCTLCPRNCRVDRSRQKGVCQSSDRLMVSRAALHMWEEPCISAKEGSGAVFFAGCSLHCVFCQNFQISNGQMGQEISKEHLTELFYRLQEQGANNINLVTPDHYLPCRRLGSSKSKERWFYCFLLSITAAVTKRWNHCESWKD